MIVAVNGTYHGDCMGITPDIGQEMKDDNMECICPSCTSDTTLVSFTSVDPPTSSVVIIHVEFVWIFSGEIKRW